MYIKYTFQNINRWGQSKIDLQNRSRISIRILFCKSRVERKSWKIENRKYIKTRKSVNMHAAQFGRKYYKLQASKVIDEITHFRRFQFTVKITHDDNRMIEYIPLYFCSSWCSPLIEFTWLHLATRHAHTIHDFLSKRFGLRPITMWRYLFLAARLVAVTMCNGMRCAIVAGAEHFQWTPGHITNPRLDT